MKYNEDRVKRIASFITITADLLDGKPEYTRMDDLQSKYIYDPKHEKSKADVQRELKGPVHETPKGWAEGAEQLDLFKNAPATSNENKDLFGQPVPADKAMLPVQAPVEPPKPELPQPKPDLEGQQTMPIVDPIVQQPSLPEAPKTEAPKPVAPKQKDPDALRKAVKAISRHYNSPKSLEKVPKGMLESIGGNISKFDVKGMDIEMAVNSPNGVKKLVVKHDASPINETDKDMQALHSVGSAWAISSGLADDEAFQSEASKAMTKDMDNFVSRFTDLPFPGEENRTYSPANWVAKGRFNPKTKAAFYKMFARGMPETGEKNALMVRSFLGAMQVASDGEYGSGTPAQADNDASTKVANMAGYVAQGFANDSGFMKKNMPLTTKLFESKMV